MYIVMHVYIFSFFQILRFLGFIVTPDFGDRSVTIHQLLPVFVISLLLEDLAIVSYQKWARSKVQGKWNQVFYKLAQCTTYLL